jgi:hypothetical protein
MFVATSSTPKIIAEVAAWFYKEWPVATGGSLPSNDARDIRARVLHLSLDLARPHQCRSLAEKRQRLAAGLATTLSARRRRCAAACTSLRCLFGREDARPAEASLAEGPRRETFDGHPKLALIKNVQPNNDIADGLVDDRVRRF